MTRKYTRIAVLMGGWSVERFAKLVPGASNLPTW